MRMPTVRKSLVPPLARTILCVLPGLAAPAASAADAGALPHLHLESLERIAPGWVATESSGDARTGSVAIERIVWPLFYLHWRPLTGPGGVGDKLSITEAEKAVADLWEGRTFDNPPDGRKVSLPAHEGVIIDSNTSHGEWKSRYIVWACPDSGRLFIADINASLQVNAPAQLLDLMESMARTVRCHENSKIDEYPALKNRHDVEGTDISIGLPFGWYSIPGYRVQKQFSGADFSQIKNPASTKAQGQELLLELDCLRRLYLFWEPAPDDAMTFETLLGKVQTFWRSHAIDLAPGKTRVSNDVWMMDGMAIAPPENHIPPSRAHKFRAWMWRKDGVSYMAVGEMGGVRFGRVMSQMLDIADQLLEEMFQAIDY